jgi:AcrR family transcriptional regulator
MAQAKPKQIRDPDATRARILSAARHEFAGKGLGGARVDKIATRARANKRMMYHYFGNKEDLFRITLEEAYAAFRAAEAALAIEKDEPIIAMSRLVAFTWSYYLEHPEFITLVNTENLHQARHLKASKRAKSESRAFVARMQALLERGQKDGAFRSDLDAVQVLITIAAIGYHYLTNRFTGSIVYSRDMMAEKALNERLAFNTATILRVVCTPEALARIKT